MVPSVDQRGSAGTEVEQKSSLSAHTEFVKVTRKPSGSSTAKKLKPTIKIGVGLVKNEFITRTTQPRPKTPIQKHPFPKSNYNTQPNYQNGWTQSLTRHYQVPNYMSWNPHPPFPYMNSMFNQNGPMRYWGPNV